MAEVGTISTRARSLKQLEKQLARLLAQCPADQVLGVSHSAAAVSIKQSGGIWGAARHTQKIEYSAVVLIRRP